MCKCNSDIIFLYIQWLESPTCTLLFKCSPSFFVVFLPGTPCLVHLGLCPALTSWQAWCRSKKKKKVCDNLKFRLRLQTHYSKPCDFAHWCHRFLHTPQTLSWPSHLTKKVPPISQTDLWALRAPLLDYGVIKTFPSIATAHCHTFMYAHTHCWHPEVVFFFLDTVFYHRV